GKHRVDAFPLGKVHQGGVGHLRLGCGVAIHKRNDPGQAVASSSASSTNPLSISPPNALYPPGSSRRSHAASVKTGQQVSSSVRSVLRAATHFMWAFSRPRTIATRGPVSATARLLTPEAFHMLWVRAQVGRGAWRTFDAADQTRAARHVESRFFGVCRCRSGWLVR